MATVVKKEFVPIPPGIYNLQILGYEQKENSKTKGQYFYQWKISVKDKLPEDYNGRGELTVLTPVELTAKNKFNKFLLAVGMEEVAVGESIDLDQLIGQLFVGKVIVKDNTNGTSNNDLGELTVPEYERFKQRQQANVGKATATKRPSVQQPVQSGNQQAPVQQQSRPSVQQRPVQQQRQVQQPVEAVSDSNEAVQGDIDGFPE